MPSTTCRSPPLAPPSPPPLSPPNIETAAAAEVREMILRRDEDGIIVPACSLALCRALSMVLASADTPDTDEDQVDRDVPVSFPALILLLLLLLLLSLLPLVLLDAEANDDAAALVRPLLLLPLLPLFFRASDFDVAAASPLSDMAAAELALDEADLRDVVHVLSVLVVQALAAALLVLLVLDATRVPVPVSSCASGRCR